MKIQNQHNKNKKARRKKLRTITSVAAVQQPLPTRSVMQRLDRVDQMHRRLLVIQSSVHIKHKNLIGVYNVTVQNRVLQLRNLELVHRFSVINPLEIDVGGRRLFVVVLRRFRVLHDERLAVVCREEQGRDLFGAEHSLELPFSFLEGVFQLFLVGWRVVVG